MAEIVCNDQVRALIAQNMADFNNAISVVREAETKAFFANMSAEKAEYRAWEFENALASFKNSKQGSQNLDSYRNIMIATNSLIFYNRFLAMSEKYTDLLNSLKKDIDRIKNEIRNMEAEKNQMESKKSQLEAQKNNMASEKNRLEAEKQKLQSELEQNKKETDLSIVEGTNKLINSFQTRLLIKIYQDPDFHKPAKERSPEKKELFERVIKLINLGVQIKKESDLKEKTRSLYEYSLECAQLKNFTGEVACKVNTDSFQIIDRNPDSYDYFNRSLDIWNNLCKHTQILVAKGTVSNIMKAIKLRKQSGVTETNNENLSTTIYSDAIKIGQLTTAEKQELQNQLDVIKSFTADGNNVVKLTETLETSQTEINQVQSDISEREVKIAQKMNDINERQKAIEEKEKAIKKRELEIIQTENLIKEKSLKIQQFQQEIDYKIQYINKISSKLKNIEDISDKTSIESIKKAVNDYKQEACNLKNNENIARRNLNKVHGSLMKKKELFFNDEKTLRKLDTQNLNEYNQAVNSLDKIANIIQNDAKESKEDLVNRLFRYIDYSKFQNNSQKSKIILDQSLYFLKSTLTNKYDSETIVVDRRTGSRRKEEDRRNISANSYRFDNCENRSDLAGRRKSDRRQGASIIISQDIIKQLMEFK